MTEATDNKSIPPEYDDTIFGCATDFFKSTIIPLEVNQKSHYSACEANQKYDKYSSIALWIAAMCSMAFAFADIQKIFDYAPIILGVMTFIATIISGVQVFANFSGISRDHQSAAIGYGKLLRDARSRIDGGFSETENKKAIHFFLEEWHTVSSNAPLTTQRQRRKWEVG